MKDILKTAKLVFVSATGFLSAKLGILAPLLTVLIVAMLLDYISGIINASLNGKLNSKSGFLGILKKLCYGIIIGVALAADKIIVIVGAEFSVKPITAVFGMITVVWLILNELLSILENLGEIGVPMPDFLKGIIEKLKANVENEAENKREEK